MIMDRLVEFLGALLKRHDMTDITLQSILDKVTAQGVAIDQLVAVNAAKEQADLAKIDALIDANGAKVTAALTPAVVQPVATDPNAPTLGVTGTLTTG